MYLNVDLFLFGLLKIQCAPSAWGILSTYFPEETANLLAPVLQQCDGIFFL